MADKDFRQGLLDELASLGPEERQEVATTLRQVADTFAEVPDGRHAAHTIRLLAHFLDPSPPA